MAFGASTFLDLPLEIRLMVYNIMLEEVPTGYAYTPEVGLIHRRSDPGSLPLEPIDTRPGLPSSTKQSSLAR